MRAFTLVEMLVVITIALVLIIAATAGSFVVMERAKGAICAGNMRSVGNALMAYRLDHSGWFSPTSGPLYPTNSFNFSTELVPNYLAELPICPSATKKMTPAEKKIYGTAKAWFQKTGGTYALNRILAQWKLEALPAPLPWWTTYQPSKTPFLLEIYFCYGNSTSNAFTHQTSTLNGLNESFWGVPGRNHGGKRDALNFMFVDGHIELISQNDPRDLPDDQKSWIYPTNPNGRFGAESGGLRFIQTGQFSVAQYGIIFGEKETTP